MFNIYSLLLLNIDWMCVLALGQVSWKRNSKTEIRVQKVQRKLSSTLVGEWRMETALGQENNTAVASKLRSSSREDLGPWGPPKLEGLYRLKTRKLNLYTSTLSLINQSRQVSCSPQLWKGQFCLAWDNF